MMFQVSRRTFVNYLAWWYALMIDKSTHIEKKSTMGGVNVDKIAKAKSLLLTDREINK